MYFGLTNLIQNKIIKVVNDTIKKYVITNY